MYNFLAGVTAPFSSPPQQQQQLQAASSAPTPVCHHQVTASAIPGGKPMHDTSLLLRSAARRRNPSNIHSGFGQDSLAAALKQERTNVPDLHSILSRPVAPPSSSAVHILDGIVQQAVQQPHQHPFTATLQSHEHAGNTTTPVPGLSLPLPPQQPQPSSAVILSGESLCGHFERAPYSPFRPTEVHAIPSQPEASQQHYGSASHPCLYDTSRVSCSQQLLQAPASLQRHQQQRLPVSSNVWTAATATAIMPPSPFASPSLQSLTAGNPPGYSCCVSGNAVPAPPATIPAPHLPSAALSMSSQSQTTQSTLAKTPPIGQSCASTTRLSTHTIVIGHPAVNRGRAGMLQPAISTVLTRPHGLTDANAHECLGTAYYFEAVARGDSIGNNSGHSYPSMITTMSRPPPPLLQQHYLQPAQQHQHLTVEQQPVYSHLISHDGKISHFLTHTAAAGAATQSSPSMLSSVAQLTSVSSSANGADRTGALQEPTTADMNSYIGQSSWHQLQQQQQHQFIRQVDAAGPVTDARGIARRNRRRQKNKGNAVLFVGQLNYDVTEKDVRDLFSYYGHVVNVVLLKDTKHNSGKGASPQLKSNKHVVGSSAFVTYTTTAEADLAILSLHNRYCMDNRDKPVQVSYCQKTDIISDFGYRHALQLHSENPANPIPSITPTPTIAYAIKFA
ncbi:hypothetical protein LSCM4_02463 [Leishmania orientalis]|uniref:RRM domain-containing protein n=1 Tax=Leishmania orientalis TaxID=2249476 RepID=A0A836GJY9_9TRYP|nr:hypothetical protein LSCM4_02463 [Leishmania orientalis]